VTSLDKEQEMEKSQNSLICFLFLPFHSDSTFFSGVLKNSESVAEIFGKLNLKLLLSTTIRDGVCLGNMRSCL
jgi:hypothetical protein